MIEWIANLKLSDRLAYVWLGYPPPSEPLHARPVEAVTEKSHPEHPEQHPTLGADLESPRTP